MRITKGRPAGRITLCFILTVCTGSQHAKAAPYTNAKYGVSIQFPQDWYLKPSTVDNILIKSRRRSDLLAFMSLSAYDLDEAFNISDASPEQLLDVSLGFNESIDAVLLQSGSLSIGNAQAQWIKYDMTSPALATGYSIDCYIVNGTTLFKVGGRTDRELAWFEQNEPLFMEAFRSVHFHTADANTTMQASLKQHSDSTHGFLLSYPADWTVKSSAAEGTVFKAVKKFANGEFLIFTVNAQLLDRSDYSMTDFTIDDIIGLPKKMYGQDNVTVLDAHRDQIGEHPCIKVLLDTRPPIVQPRTEYVVNVIQNRYLYTISVSCNKTMYQRYAQLMRQLGDSFTFVSPTRSAASGRVPTWTDGNCGYRLVITDFGEEPGPALVKAFGETWLKCVVIGTVFAAGSALWVKMKGKKKTGMSNKAIDSDKK